MTRAVSYVTKPAKPGKLPSYFHLGANWTAEGAAEVVRMIVTCLRGKDGTCAPNEAAV
jgi:hypothetical protein